MYAIGAGRMPFMVVLPGSAELAGTKAILLPASSLYSVRHVFPSGPAQIAVVPPAAGTTAMAHPLVIRPIFYR